MILFGTSTGCVSELINNTNNTSTNQTQLNKKKTTLEPTQLPIITPTSTERKPRPPTPTPETEIAKQILEFYETNLSCETLPCWWGIVPGVTKWEEARIILEPLSNRISDPYVYPEPIKLENYSVYVFSPPEHFPAFWDKGNKYQIYVVDIDNSIVQYIKAPTGSFRKYQIPNTLSKYGNPDDVLFLASHAYGNHYFVDVYLYFSDFYFFAKYSTEVETEGIKEGVVTACYQDSSELFLWPVDKEMTYNDMFPLGITDFTDESMNYFKDISEVTEYDESYFHDVFVNSELPVCIDVKTDFWFTTNK
jgi:hypothetical protein